MNKKIAIYISSFDGYSDIWSTFFKIFDKYWPDCQYNKYLVTNEMKYEYKDLITIKTGKENDWFYRTIKSLESIDEDYVLFLLEDYFLSKNQYNKTYDSIIDYMYSENIYYYQLSSVQSKSKEAVADYNKDISYPISLQAAIWNRKEFLNILYEIYDKGAKTPWEFEKYFVLLNKEPKKIKNYTSGIRYNTEDILGYKNGVLQGKWILKTVNFYKKRGIVIDTTKRGIQTKLDSIKYNLKKFFSKHLNNTLYNIVKSILKKLGYKFMID